MIGRNSMHVISLVFVVAQELLEAVYTHFYENNFSKPGAGRAPGLIIKGSIVVSCWLSLVTKY